MDDVIGWRRHLHTCPELGFGEHETAAFVAARLRELIPRQMYDVAVQAAIGANIIGVNARNLKTLDINDDAFSTLLPLIPGDRIRVAESGISTRSQDISAQAAGAKDILVGETLVRAGDPALAINSLLGRKPAGTVGI